MIILEVEGCVIGIGFNCIYCFFLVKVVVDMKLVFGFIMEGCYNEVMWMRGCFFVEMDVIFIEFSELVCIIFDIVGDVDCKCVVIMYVGGLVLGMNIVVCVVV